MLDNSNKDIEYWRHQANNYEWMFREQKAICEGYKKIIDEYRLILGVDKTKLEE